jgi:hypothetical protein
MGIYADYLTQNLTGEPLNQERKKQLKRISEIRQREILVFASALTKTKAPIGIDNDDIIPFTDQLNNLKGDKIDIILETPGGSGEHAEHIIECIRKKFKEVSFIVPGSAMSAGTIMVMAGDEILMSPSSALGPIDAQIIRAGKQFSAQAFLDGLEKIKEEVTKTGILNKAYIPILQNISPGEIQSAQNAWDFAKELVTAWLAKYKFRSWIVHKGGIAVTDFEREKRAAEIAEQLRDHGQWKTHGRRIRIDDLRKMKLKITDYSEDNKLAQAIDSYFILLKMSFDAGTAFKIYETIESQIYRHTPIIQGLPMLPVQDIEMVGARLQCPQCKAIMNIQANFKKGVALKPGFMPMPQADKISCISCQKEINLVDLKKAIEGQTQRKIVYD